MTTTLRRPGPSGGVLADTARPAPAPRLRVPGRGDTGLYGAVVGALVVGGAVAGCFVGAAPVLQLGYPAVAVLAALALLVQRRWYSYLSFTLVVWLASYGVRRVIDWQTVYHSASPVIITGSLVSLVALPWVMTGRRPAYRDARVALYVAAVVACYGLATGVIANGVAPALADFLLLGAPLVTGLFVMAVPEDDARLERVVSGLALWGSLLLGGYAIVQFLVLPAWDAAWITDSGITSVGKAEAGQFRAFGTLSTTGPLGYTMAVLLLLLVAERRVWRQTPVAMVGLAALAITLIRGGWIGLTIGVLLLASRGRKPAWRFIVIVAVLLVAVFSIGGPIRDAVTARVSDTASEGTQDTSLVARVNFQAEVAPEALTNPVGDGMGATGVATDLSDDDLGQRSFRNFDSGLFETLTRYGVLAGSALLGTAVWTVARTFRRSRRSSLFDAACGSALVALALGLILTDTLRSVYGLLFWLLVAVQGRPRRSRSRSESLA